MIGKGIRISILTVVYLLLLALVLILIDNFVLPSMTSGQATISVPYVVGKNVEFAKKEIIKRNLKFEIDKEQYSDKIPAGTIISQIPSSKSLVKKGRFIYVTVSKGEELVIVPYIKGQVSRNAKINLMKVGLDIGNIDYKFSETVGKDTILLQSIPSNLKV